MAKIEEVTALLIDEIEMFQKAVNQLHSESEKIQNTSFKIDASHFENVLNQFLEKINNDYELHQTEFKQLKKELNKTIIFPKWMIVLLSTFFLATIISFSIVVYQNKQQKKAEDTAYNKGIDDMKNHIRLFFDENSSAEKAYQKWQKDN